MTSPRAIPDTWTEWLQHNRDRGCAREGLIERAMAHGFDRDAIEAVLAVSYTHLTLPTNA